MVMVVMMMMCASAYMYSMHVGVWKCACYSAHGEVRVRLSGVGSLLLPWALGMEHRSSGLHVNAFPSESSPNPEHSSWAFSNCHSGLCWMFLSWKDSLDHERCSELSQSKHRTTEGIHLLSTTVPGHPLGTLYPGFTLKIAEVTCTHSLLIIMQKQTFKVR